MNNEPVKTNELPELVEIIGIKFRNTGKVYYFSPGDIKKLSKEDTVFVMPESMSEQAAGLPGKTVTLAPGEKKKVCGYETEGVPAYNIGKKFHQKQSGWLGYIVAVEGKKIYVVGDSDATPEMLAAELKTQVETDPDTTILVRADESLPYGKVVTVLRIMHDAQITRLALVTDPGK